MDLLSLQGCIKRDPDGYLDEFRQQYRHYKACLEIFKLQPSKESHEFSSLVGFVAQVAPCYPKEVQGFAAEISGLLEEQATALDSATRLALVRALILMRNRGVLTALDILPTLFRLFRCQDKALRQLLFRHIVADIKSANRKHRDNKLNRGVQAFLYGLLQQEEEAAALRALAVLTELHRRNVWRDARTVNVIASATQHPSSRVMLAALKFFLGQDEVEDAGSDDDEDGGSRKQESGMAPPPPTPSSKEVYAAKAKGTNSSKKKKAAKLKRAMQAVKKAERRTAGSVSESFAAMQLLHDPQTFAERLFSRLQKANERLETRLAMMSVISRAVGVHKLLLLNFYPFLQKYIQPHQRDVTNILAILIQAVHELVPPDVLAPVLKQLADQFINDRTRPEVMVVGMRAVRELAQRAPLLMTPDLLQDLAEYRKYKHKEVSSAARSLVSLFRQINPSLLAKKDRGRNADLGKAPLEYGASAIPDRIEGAELLQAAELAGSGDSEASSDSELELGSDAEDGVGSDADSDAEAAAIDGSHDGAAQADAASEPDDEDGSGWELASDEEAAEEAAEAEAGSGKDEGDSDAAEGGSSGASGSVLELDSSDAAGVGGETDSDAGTGSAAGSDEDVPGGEDDPADASGDDKAGEAAAARKGRGAKRRAPSGLPDSLKTLKKQLTDARATAAAKQAALQQGGQAPSAGEQPLEWGRILTGEDFERIRELRHKKLVDDTLARHGLKQKAVNAHRMERLREAAEGEAEELLDAQDVSKSLSEQRVRGGELASKHKGRRDKAERMATVLAGREGREFGAAAARKKNKTGGLSNRQQQKVKRMPAAARAMQLKRRSAGKPRGKAAKKAQRGHTGASAFGRAKGGRKKN